MGMAPPRVSCLHAVGADRDPIAREEISYKRHCIINISLHYEMLVWQCLDVPDITAKPEGLLTTRTR